MLDRYLHHLPPIPAQQATYNIKTEADLTESYYTAWCARQGAVR